MLPGSNGSSLVSSLVGRGSAFLCFAPLCFALLRFADRRLFLRRNISIIVMIFTHDNDGDITMKEQPVFSVSNKYPSSKPKPQSDDA
jgi:hypothetical protein